MDKTYQALLDAIEKIIDAPGSWASRKAAFVAYAKVNANSSLAEFLGWVEPEELDDL